MKKVVFVLVVCLILVGCGKKSGNNTNGASNNEDSIDLKLGTTDMTFKESIITCGDKQVQSSVSFNTDKKASYEFYDCHDGNVILEASSGNYSTNDLDVILTNSYDEKIKFEITANNKIELKSVNKTIRTFTN